MLGCCHCLCSKEYSALTCVESCYPNDGRPDPVHARVRELINWGTHDIDRFSTIHEILAEKIQQDVNRGNDAGVTVGLKIMASLLNNVRELNHNISTTMTQCITQLIETRKKSLLEIAANSTQDLIQYTNTHMLAVPISRIINAYLILLSDESLKDTIFQSVNTIVSQSQLQWVPITNVLQTLCPNFFAENPARDIIKSIAHICLPLSLNRLTADLFSFFSERNLWTNEDFITSILVLFFTEIPDNCAPGFFRSWLEQLPPRSAEAGHSKTIIDITVRIVEQISPERLISQAQTDSLSVLYLFVLNLPQLMYDDKAAILNNSLVIEDFIVNHIPFPELLKIAHRQIWEWLPEPQDKQIDYDHEKVALIFRFASTFNIAAKKNLTKMMVTDSMAKIKKFLTAFKHDEEILRCVLDHLQVVSDIYPTVTSDIIVNFLLDLQKDVKKRGNDITLHTFIMKAFCDASRDGPPMLKDYVHRICQMRIDAQPPQVDLSLSFITEEFQQLKSVKPGAKPSVTIFFKKKEIKPRRMSSAMFLHPQFTEQTNDLEEEEEVSEVIPAIPALVFQDDGEVSEASAMEPVPATYEEALEKQNKATFEHKQFLSDIQNIDFEWKSNVPLPSNESQSQ